MLPPRPELPPTSARSQWRSITVGSQRAALGIMRKSMKRPLRLFVNPSERQALAAALEQVISDVKVRFVCACGERARELIALAATRRICRIWLHR